MNRACPLLLTGFLGLSLAASDAQTLPTNPLLPHHPSFANVTSPEVKNLASLVGCWTGRAPHEFDATATYQLASNGTALVESLKSEQNHFYSVTVYYLDGETPMADHYCAYGSQIRMRSERSPAPNVVAFKMVGATNLHHEEEPHMNAVKFTFHDRDHFDAQWGLHGQGKDFVKTWVFTRAGGDCK